MFDALARLATFRGRTVVIVAVALAAIAGVLGSSVADRLDPYGAEDPATESAQANDRLERAGYQQLGLIALVEGVDVRSPATQRRVEALAAEIAQDPAVGSVATFYNTGSRDLVGDDATYIAARFAVNEDSEEQDAAERITERLQDEPGVTLGGPAVAQQQVNEQVEEDLRRAEMLAFPLLFVLSLLFFRSLVAALLPLLIGGLAIVGSFFMLRMASEFGSISIFAINLVTGLGLGLAIDYSLFIVSRYREEMAKSGPGLQAMRRTLATSGRTVLFSSLTVAGAIASLAVFPQRFLYSMGIGGALVALIAATIALVVLPAVLALLGHRVNSLSPAFLQRRAEADARPATSGFWYRLSRFVMRRPAPIATVSALVLIILGLPFLGIRFTSVDPSVLPESASARQVDEALESRFPPNRDTPIQLAVESANPALIDSLTSDIERLPGVAAVQPPQRLDDGVAAVEVISDSRALTDTSQDLVDDIRALPYSEVAVTGFTAEYEDLQTSLLDHLPTVLAIVIGVTLVVLFLMTGSVVLPLKAVLMNALGLSAVFGLLVLIFQDGRFEGLLSYQSQGALEMTQPLLLFAVAFGLSTDYGVFLLARIKEARDSGLSDSESVAVGLERTGRIVTAAAVLFCVAIGAFATSEIIFIKELGVGTALAVLIDATIVRALLVPSLMELLGRWNWWAPQPLRRLHARLGLSET